MQSGAHTASHLWLWSKQRVLSVLKGSNSDEYPEAVPAVTSVGSTQEECCSNFGTGSCHSYIWAGSSAALLATAAVLLIAIASTGLGNHRSKDDDGRLLCQRHP